MTFLADACASSIHKALAAHPNFERTSQAGYDRACSCESEGAWVLQELNTSRAAVTGAKNSMHSGQSCARQAEIEAAGLIWTGFKLLRVEDEYCWEGDVGGLYAGDDPMPEFLRFLSQAEQRGVLPRWWDVKAVEQCTWLALNAKGDHYLHHYGAPPAWTLVSQILQHKCSEMLPADNNFDPDDKVTVNGCQPGSMLCQGYVPDHVCHGLPIVEKHDIQEIWNDQLMPMKLRVLAEGIYGRALGAAGDNFSDHESSDYETDDG
ncbi:hypothetical protein MMC29_001294 [Sticta canariensis]|nr:hypothetical protein [Sticta canariensis]